MLKSAYATAEHAANAAMSRADIPEDQRRDFCLYVDEFQNFSTDSFADILSQARKFHLNMIVANQFTTQLSEEIRDAVFGNVGTVVSFRVGTNDAEFLTKQFQPVFDLDDLQFLPNYNTVVRMMIGGVPVQPFSMAILPPLGNPNPQLADALKQLSAAKYGRPKAQVDAEITKRLSAPAMSRSPGIGSPGASPFGAYGSTMPPMGARGNTPLPPPPPSSPMGQTAARSLPPAPKAGSSSFLDEWLAKRKSPLTNRQSPFGPPPATASRPLTQAELPSAQPAPAASGGELKIKRDSKGSTTGGGDSQTIHIDPQGNLTYDE